MLNYDKLEVAIKKSGKTKTYLCEKLGRPPYYLRDVLKQKNAIPAQYQQILAQELSVTVEWLNDECEKKPATNGDGLSEERAEWANAWGKATPAQRKAALAVLMLQVPPAED